MLDKIDRKYGIVIEASRAQRIVEYDEETFSESEWEEIEIEFTYKRNKKIFRDVLPLSHFIPIYRDAKSIIKRSRHYIHSTEEGAIPFDVIEYMEEIIRREKEQTGPMFG